MTRKPVDWGKIGDKTCELLSVYLKKRAVLEAAARERQTTFESLIAAAIVEMIREEIETQEGGGFRGGSSQN
jgi:hypothetical protein